MGSSFSLISTRGYYKVLGLRGFDSSKRVLGVYRIMYIALEVIGARKERGITQRSHRKDPRSFLGLLLLTCGPT